MFGYVLASRRDLCAAHYLRGDIQTMTRYPPFVTLRYWQRNHVLPTPNIKPHRPRLSLGPEEFLRDSSSY